MSVPLPHIDSEHIAKLRPPEKGCRPHGVPVEDALGLFRMLAWQEKVSNDIGIDDDHNRPSSLAA